MKAANFSSQFAKFFTVERTLLIIFIVALLLRFLFLDLKLFHHDESIHSWFSIRLLNEGIYSYDPVYHGPFLYYATAGMFAVFGTGEFAARIMPSVLGTLCVLLVYPIYRLGYLDKKQTILAAVFIAVSPCMVYFSRFLRNDILIVFFTLVLLVALLYYIEKKELRYALLGAVAAGLAMSCKENVPIILLIFGSYLIYLVYRGRFTLPKYWIRDLVLSAVVLITIMAIFYSAFGMHPNTIIDGPFEALDHWLSMHNEQRLGGPFYFYLILFIMYEIPILILAGSGVLAFLRWKGNKNISKENFVEDTLEVKDSCCNEIPLKSISIPDKNREFTRFCIFWMFASLAVYAYIGEKVPWLILHQLLPMIFVAVYDLSRWKIWFSAAAAVFLIIMAMHVAFTPADVAEPIVQVQNSESLREVMVLIDSADRVAISDYVRWPFVWYCMDDYPSKIYYYPDSDKYSSDKGPQDFDLIILHDGENISEIPGFTKYRYKKCYWIDVYNLVQSARMKADIWDENYRNTVISDIKRIVSYYFTRDTSIGSINMDVFVKNRQAI